MVKKKKVLIVFGTRPEAIKMAPVVKAFRLDDNYEVKVCSTGQHQEMLYQVTDFFGITIDVDLKLMKPNQNLFNLTGEIINGLRPILESFKPDCVFVHGDTTTSMAAGLSAFYSRCTVAHVEAGLRTNNRYSPFPEEINRQITARLTHFHFAPTSRAKASLIKENIEEETIFVTGNTVIDALFEGLEILKSQKEDPTVVALKELVAKTNKKPIILVTGHRRENFGDGFLNICKALKKLAEEQDCHIIYPVHLNPNVQKPVNELLFGLDNIHLIPPQPYQGFIWLMNQSKLVITDSGGVQEEAPSLGKPVLVMRKNTERPEAVDAGTVKLVGTDPKEIFYEAEKLLKNEQYYNEMSAAHNPYGDGLASSRIVSILTTNLNEEKPS